MKSGILYCLVLLSITPVCAQSQWGIKLYNNIDRYEVTTFDRRTHKESKTSTTNVARLSLALHYHSSKKLAHEIEMTFSRKPASFSNGELPFPDQHLSTTDEGIFATETSSYALRYEVNSTLFTLSKFVDLNLGVGINPYRATIDSRPLLPNYYERITRYEGTTVNVTPRVIFKISKRFSVDVNIPFNVYALYRKTDDIHNPNIPLSQQVKKEWFSRFFPNTYTLRGGIMYLLKV